MSIWKDTVTLNCRIDTISSIDSLWHLWNQNEPKHYLYRVNMLCFCEPPLDFQIEVSNSEIDTIYLIGYDEGEYGTLTYEKIQQSGGRLLIDSLFSFQKKFDSIDPESTSKSFQNEFNFPCHFYYDYSSTIADEEYGVQITLFVVAEY